MEKKLGEDMILSILVKLPVKSLLRFKCVDKSWFRLIKSSYFINMHLVNNSKRNDSILVNRSLEDYTKNVLSFHSYASLHNIHSSPDLQIPHFHRPWASVDVSGPCNGLLCFSSNCGTILLCNPSMREFKLLPPRPFLYPEGWRWSVEGNGLGFDSVTHDYKVVIFIQLAPLKSSSSDVVKSKFEIYNLSTNSWREIDHDNTSKDFYAAGHGTLFKGASHWISVDYNRNVNHYILCFCMSTEVFHCMELPCNNSIEIQDDDVLMVLHESLAFFSYSWRRWDEERFIDVWVMQQYGVKESWTKYFTIGPVAMLRPILLWKNEAILLEVYERVLGKGRLVSCAFDTNKITYFDIYGIEDTLRVIVHQESLISLE